MPIDGAQTLGDHQHLKRLEVRCRRCDRHDFLRMSELIAFHGPDCGLPEVGEAWTSECPNHGEQLYNRCSPWFPVLAER